MAGNGTNFKKLRRLWQILLDVMSTQARDEKKMTLKVGTSHATGEGMRDKVPLVSHDLTRTVLNDEEEAVDVQGFEDTLPDNGSIRSMLGMIEPFIHLKAPGAGCGR